MTNTPSKPDGKIEFETEWKVKWIVGKLVEGTTNSWYGVRCAIIDSESKRKNFLEDTISEIGFRVDSLDNEEDFGEFVKTNRCITLVIVVLSSGSNPVTGKRAIQSIPEYAKRNNGKRVLYVLGMTDEESFLKSHENGICEVVPFPIEVNKLHQIITKYVKKGIFESLPVDTVQVHSFGIDDVIISSGVDLLCKFEEEVIDPVKKFVVEGEKLIKSGEVYQKREKEFGREGNEKEGTLNYLFERIVFFTHRAKGTSGQVGFSQLYWMTAQICFYARRGDLDSIKKAIPRMIEVKAETEKCFRDLYPDVEKKQTRPKGKRNLKKDRKKKKHKTGTTQS